MIIPFRTERQLVECFTGTVSLDSQKTNLCWLKELESSNGIADVVLYRLRKDWKEQDGLKHIAPRWAYALSSLPYRKSFDVDYFINRSRVTRTTALGVLKQYEAAGYCLHSGSSGNWSKVKQPRIPTNDIIAYEAKLKDWKRALRQAYRYLDYANQAWVLLDKKRINPARDNLDQFARLNVGLSCISPNGEIETIWSPVAKKPRSSILSWQANAQIAHCIL